MAHVLDARKQVLLQWLEVLNITSPEHACPRLTEDLRAPGADALLAALQTQLVADAVTDDTDTMHRVDSRLCDDVAAVRNVSDDELTEHFDRVCIMPRNPGMSVEEQRRRETSAIHATIKISTDASLENEFSDQRNMLSRAFPWVFPLGAAAAFPTVTGTLSDAVCFHMFNQSSCVAAQDGDLLFFVADQKRRHSVVRSVAAAVAPGHIQKFQDVTESPAFMTDLGLARNKDDAAAERVTTAVRPHMAIACAHVVNGPVQRAKAHEHILAMVHELGLPSMFLTVSPDFIHSAGAIRMSIPEATSDFPLASFLDSLGSGGMFSASGWTPFNMGTASLNVHMANHPIAAARDFVTNMNAVMDDLLRCPAHALTRKTPARWRTCGVFGTPYGFYCVVEAQGRGALHYHMLFWGSYSPHILSQAASDPAFKDRVLKALSTQTVAELPREMHVKRLHRRACAAAGGPVTASVRQARLPGDLVPTMDAIRSRALKAADGSSIHGHSGTCHNNEMGKHCCRMCKPENPCQHCQFTFTYLSADRTTRDIPDISVECTDRRDLALNPLPAIDHRCIVVEPPRRRDDVQLTEHEVAGLSARSRVWMNQMLPLQNMLVSAFNVAIMACVPANQAAIQLSCDNSAKQMAFYLTNYVGKDSNALKATASMLLAAMNHIKIHPSNAPDAGSASRTAAHLLTNTCNRVVGAMEVSDQQAAMTVLGFTADLSSAPFWRCMVMAAVRYVQQLLPPARPAADQVNVDAVEEHMQALEMDAPPIADGMHDASEAVFNDGDKLHAVPQHVHYALRGDQLHMLSLYEYCRLINIRPITAKDGNDTGQGRQSNGQFRFLDTHPMYASHVQVLRSKVATVVVRPVPPRMPEFIQLPPFAAGPKARQADAAAAYYTVLLRPWSIDELPQTDYASWADWTVELHTNPTALNQCRLAVMTRMSQGMSTSAENLKASKAYRFKSARRWGATGIDGTEAPPGLQEPGHMQLSPPDDTDIRIAESLDELQQMVNPKPNAAALATYKLQLEHMSCCMKQLKKLFPIARDRMLPSDSAVPRMQVGIPGADHCAAWTHAASSAAATMTFLKHTVEDEFVDHVPEGFVQLPAHPTEDQWPSLEDLTPSQAAAVRAIRPYVANRASPPNTFLMTGGPGAGKSYAIKHTKKVADAAGVKMRCGAFAAPAAMPLPNGQTLHSLVGIRLVSDVFPHPPSHAALARLRASWKNVGLFVIDEISMVSRLLLGIVSHRLSLILDNPAHFGGLCTVLSGDFRQLPSIPEPGLAAAAVEPPLDTHVGSPSALADEIFSNVTLLPLSEQKRCEDAQWNAVLEECRSSGTLAPMVASLKVLTDAEVQEDPAWQFATMATTGNELRAHVNSLQATRWASHTGTVKIRWRSTVDRWKGYAPSDEAWAACEDPRLFGEFVPGMDVVMSDNVSAESTEKGVANGRKAKLYGLSYDDPVAQDTMLRQLCAATPGDVITLVNPPDYVILDVGPVDGTEGHAGMVINADTGGLLVSLKAQPDGDTKLRVLIDGEIYRPKLNRFDYDLRFCVTFHKLQGMTLDRLVLDLRKPIYPPHHTFEFALVAASRVRQGAHVRVLTPGWSHLSECRADVRVLAWLAGFSDTGGVWNRVHAVEKLRALQANAPPAPKRRRVQESAAPKRVQCAGGGVSNKRQRAAQ